MIKNKLLLQTEGPLLITANHPNALMDALLIGAYFKRPVHFLTRGDVFNKPWKRQLLTMLNMVPIYRIRDGYKSLHLNQQAFDKSHEVLANGGIVLIFIEGICKHTHELQPFKKGAARIAIKCWQANIPLQVMPLSIRYESLFNIGSKVLLNVQTPLVQQQLYNGLHNANNLHAFNEVVYDSLATLLKQSIVKPKTKNTIRWFSLIGYWLHWPLIITCKKLTQYLTKGNEFYQSILFLSLAVCYPLFLWASATFLFIFTKMASLFILWICGMLLFALSMARG